LVLITFFTRLFFSCIENIIYGWEIDSKAPIFQLSRHKDKITDFLALDKHNLFATCSLDKRIVLWSQTTRRVKGVLQGHQRGIKVMSYAKDTLLSAGFECEATAWDLNLYEPSFYLRGHRLPLSAVKLMSQPDQQDENLRAITVDDGGEFRLWNIFVREKGSGVQLAETLQTFNQSHISDKSLCKIQFLVVPYNAMFSKEKYSDVIAASNRMIHFKPQKIAMDFFPPVCMSYSDPNACVVTAVGKSLFKYDITSGCYHSALSDIDTSEVTFFLLEGEHNRRIYVGTANGYLYLINFASGQVIGKVRAHGKDLMALTILNKKKDAHSDPDTLLYSGSTDGNIRQITECSGNLEITHTIENAMGNHRKINFMESVQEFKVLFCFALRRWAIFNLTTMKRNFLFNEKDEITGFEFLGGGGRYDKMDVKDYDEAIRIESERIVTLVVCTTTQLKVYAVDVTRFKAVLTHVLGHSHSLHFSKVCKIKFPKKESVNYISVKKKSLSLCLVAGSDEGDLTLWDAKIIRLESLKVYYQTVPDFLAQLSIKAPKMKPNKAKASTLMRAASLLRRGKGTSSFGFKKKSDRQSSYSVSSSSSITQKEFVGLEKMNEFSNISNDGDTIVKDEIESVGAIKSNAPHLRHRNAIIHSLSKPIYKVSEVPQNDEDALSQVSVTSIESFSGVDADRDARKMKLAIGQSSMALIEEMDTSEDYRLSELTGNEKDAVYIPSHMSFKAHTDVIHNVEPLPEHGCIVSSSQDGYHRVWNLLGDCLGEMPLPNITDKMKKDPGRYSDVWKFVAEKIPVTNAHIAFSKLIVKNIEEGLYDEQVFVERRKAIDAGLIALKKSKSEKIMMQIKSPSDETRVRMLGDLAYGPSEASHSSINSMKKGAGTLLKQASNRFDEDDDGSMCSDNSSLTPTLAHTAGSTLFSNLDVGCRDEKKKMKKKDIDAYDSVFDSEDLWNPISKVLGKCSVAFSDSSIATAHTQGLFDEVGIVTV
jgi:WD40 repeat protein